MQKGGNGVERLISHRRAAVRLLATFLPGRETVRPSGSGPTMNSAGPGTSLAALGRGAFAYLQPDGGWGLNNAGILVGSGGVTLVDTAMTIARTERLRDAASSVAAGRPVRVVVNTHEHPDHTFGNVLFPGAAIVAHERSRRRAQLVGLAPLAALDVDWGPVELRLPDVTFEGTARLFVDDEPVELLHLGAAHTLGDVVVWLPERKLLYTGDVVVVGTTPLMMDGSLRSYAATLERLRALGAETIVPGHGPVTDAACFAPIERYVRFVQDVAREAFAAGLTPLEAARRADLGEFAAWPESERLVANLHRAYAELAGEPDGAPIAHFVELFRDMMAAKGAPLEWKLGLTPG
jgi:cyclase